MHLSLEFRFIKNNAFTNYCFVQSLQAVAVPGQVTRIMTKLYGSLGATGKGHGLPQAIIFGLQWKKSAALVQWQPGR